MVMISGIVRGIVFVSLMTLMISPIMFGRTFFELEWKKSRYLWDRKLFVMGDKLRLVTNVDNINEKFDWVKKIIEQTNKIVEEYNRKAEARETEIEEQLKETNVR
jgi:uncharacterized protein YlxW (UPF0749 family)